MRAVTPTSTPVRQTRSTGSSGRIRQRGTQGLTAELSQRAGMNSRDGAQNYAAGQKQLSSAMIPYSMGVYG